MYRFRKHCDYSDAELKKMLKYAPPEHFAVANIEPDPNLKDPLLTEQNNQGDSSDTESQVSLPAAEVDEALPEEPNEEQDILPPEEATIDKPDEHELGEEKLVVVERYLSRVFECEQCDYKASFKANLFRHHESKKHTGMRISGLNDMAPQKTVRKLHCCGECGFQTFVTANFTQHQQIWKHTTSSSRDVEVDKVLEKFPTCPHCGVQRANLERHIAKWCRGKRVKKQKKPPPPPKRRRKPPLKNITSIGADPNVDIKPVIEQPLPTVTVQDTQLSEELLKELAEKPVVVEKYLSKVFECEQCDYRSSFKGNVMRHHQHRQHTGFRVTIPSDKAPRKAIKKLQCCGECSFQTFVRINLTRHQRMWKHTAFTTKDVEVNRILEKFPTCPHCGVQRANLELHMAKWCRVLRGRKRKYPRRAPKPVKESSQSSASDDDEEQEQEQIELKFEVDNSEEIIN